MFCNQCEQSAVGGCRKVGVCGKDNTTDLLQDLLIYALAGLGEAVLKAKEKGKDTEDIDAFTCEAIFSTLTNVNFDPERIDDYINRAVEYRDKLAYDLDLTLETEPAKFVPAETKEGRLEQAQKVELTLDNSDDKDVMSLKLTTLYGVKGLASYAFHAWELGKKNEDLFKFVFDVLIKLYQNGDMQQWLNLALEAGKFNIVAMELLDNGHVEKFGNPEPTRVSIGTKKGKAILVSGHDLLALEKLLEQTKDKGIYIYTHGEMLPAHGYPGLKKYEHLVAHYGTAWQNQRKEFDEFPGPIVMTTNCLMPPKDSYKDRVYTMGPVGYPGVKHIKDHDFSQVIEHAISLPGFDEDKETDYTFTGFARNAVLSVADKIVELVKAGKLRHFFLVGGCDGARPGRNYYTEFVEKAPEDTIILTLACGKFRFFTKKLGSIDGIPRLLDMGQCNDAYSAVQVALKLAEVFNTDVNSLPLSLILSWYEQKAVAILLSLLYLGIKNIKIGPTAPQFFTENVLKFIQQNYNLQLIKTPDEDLKEILG
ncbi:hydroxylamine reductase [Thermosulfidibacter takaii]|nr:hydroxylamine reductase [Thermosulfidibacter takaii]